MKLKLQGAWRTGYGTVVQTGVSDTGGLAEGSGLGRKENGHV